MKVSEHPIPTKDAAIVAITVNGESHRQRWLAVGRMADERVIREVLEKHDPFVKHGREVAYYKYTDADEVFTCYALR